MSDGRLLIGNRRYSSWSMRGWLPVRLAKLDVEDVVIPFKAAGPSAIAGQTPSDLVPYLEHRGARVWESLSICEYCAEQAPGLWPADPAIRAHARSISAEMHAGFRALRIAMPMNLGRRAPIAITSEVRGEIDRIEAIWREARTASGGPFLFGAAFGNADAMYAPVVARLLSYGPELAADTRAYCLAVRAHPLVSEWYDAAAREPAEWLLSKYEDIA